MSKGAGRLLVKLPPDPDTRGDASRSSRDGTAASARPPASTAASDAAMPSLQPNCSLTAYVADAHAAAPAGPSPVRGRGDDDGGDAPPVESPRSTRATRPHGEPAALLARLPAAPATRRLGLMPSARDDSMSRDDDSSSSSVRWRERAPAPRGDGDDGGSAPVPPPLTRRLPDRALAAPASAAKDEPLALAPASLSLHASAGGAPPLPPALLAAPAPADGGRLFLEKAGRSERELRRSDARPARSDRLNGELSREREPGWGVGPPPALAAAPPRPVVAVLAPPAPPPGVSAPPGPIAELLVVDAAVAVGVNVTQDVVQVGVRQAAAERLAKLRLADEAGPGEGRPGKGKGGKGWLRRWWTGYIVQVGVHQAAAERLANLRLCDEAGRGAGGRGGKGAGGTPTPPQKLFPWGR
eukprot:364277-Chlamydomonas_euryale.AAC.1